MREALAHISFTKEVSTIIYAKSYHEAVSSFHDLLFARIYAERDYIIMNELNNQISLQRLV